MKSLIQFFIVLIGTIAFGNQVKSQEININQEFSFDTAIMPFTGTSPVYSVKFTGSINLLSDSSLVRVVLIDDHRNHYLIYEAYPLIINDSAFSVNEVCDETCYLDGIVPDSVRIDIINAFLTFNTLTLDPEYIANAKELQEQAKWNNDSIKIVIMNQRIQQEHMYWRAGRIPLTFLFFHEREKIFGKKFNILGFDYYKGGIFDRINTKSHAKSTQVYVDQFDWRDRHGANNPRSRYFDGDILLNTGWSTFPKNQYNCGSCYIFGTTGSIEARKNIYYNTHDYLHHTQDDISISEQDILSCDNGNIFTCSGSGMWPHAVYNYMRFHNIVDTLCFEYAKPPQDPGLIPCSSPPKCQDPSQNPYYQVRIDDYQSFGVISQENILKEMIINNGPLTSCILLNPSQNQSHCMTLVGYWTIWAGDTVYHRETMDDTDIVIEANSPIDGVTGWIFKDNFGPNGHGPFNPWVFIDNFGFFQDPLFSEICYSTGDITVLNKDIIHQCTDEDGDGYYWWGTSQFPYQCNCPPGVFADSADCNDNNVLLGPYNLGTNANIPLYQCSDNPCITLSTPYILKEDKNWYASSGDKHFKQDIIIPSGKKLTIHGQVFFTPGAKVIVQRGGTLEIEGTDTWPARLSSSCGQLWGGIEVWGNSDEPENSPEQGKVTLEKCIIENAQYGVRALRPEYETDLGGVTIPGYTGGIINATSTTFRNNKIGVVFGPYSFTNSVSWFHDCTFEETDTLIDDSFSTYLFTINGTDGVTFANCKFFNDEDACIYKSYGIYAYNSTFNFNGGNATATIENFKNLHYGIYALANSSLYGFTLTHSKFLNNVRGVYVSAYSGERITENYFSIPPCCQNCVNRYGVYLNESNGYKIEENTFTKLQQMFQENGDIGIYIRNSGPYSNEVYKNDFLYLNCAAVAAGNNRRVFPQIGLCFKCNYFTGNINDIFVNSGLEPPSQELGVAYYHGSALVPAGNSFSNPNTMDFGNYVPTANNVIYSYYNGYYLQNPDPFFNIVKNGTGFPNDCPSKLLEDKSDSIRNEKQMAQMNIDSLTLELSLLVDGGNTTSLNDEVITSTPGQALQVYDNLLQKSPNLSDTVLNSALEKEQVLNNALLRDIMVANPQSAKRDSLMQKLDLRIVPMPDSMKAEIMQGINNLSAREILESVISMYKNKERQLFHALMRNFTNDTTVITYQDSVKHLLNYDNHLESKYTLAFLYLEQDSVSKANGVLSSIPLNFSLTQKEQDLHQLYLDYFSILEQILSSNQNYPEIDSAQITSLFEIAANDHFLPGVYARNMLIAGGFLNYSEPIYLTDSSPTGPNSPIKGNIENEKNRKTDKEFYIKVYPNPAKNYIIVEFFCFSGKEKSDVHINILDLIGNIVETRVSSRNYDQILIRTDSFLPGSYVAELSVNTQKKAFTKFILVK